MEREFLQLDIWDQLTAKEAEEVARTLADNLAEPWKFHKVQFHELGDQKRHVAFFDWEGAEFTLIPGGDVLLGYDRSRPFAPDEDQLQDWKWTQCNFSFPELQEYLNQCLTPLRQVRIIPFLLEVQSHELDDPAPRGATLKKIAQAGFRFPTSDEWEHACAAGSRTLFRWGDQCPRDHYPVDRSHWDLHRMPNAFGLNIASDPYWCDFCAEAGAMRGGDGGCAICGGYGFLAGWLPLASSYFDQLLDANEQDAGNDEDAVYGAHLRRAYSLPPECLF